MKEVLEQYASYNVWANQTLLKPVLAMDETKLLQIIPSSFNSIRSTVMHIWDAESIWWQRLKLQEQIIRPSLSVQLSMQEVVTGLIDQSKQWEAWIKQNKENMLEHVFGYHDSKGVYFKNPIWQTVMHLFNHSSYHRGQIVTMYHHLEVKKIPNTDFIAWCRKK